MMKQSILKGSAKSLCGLLVAMAAISAVRADEFQVLWKLSPADGLDYITTGNTERGAAYNPVSKRVILVARGGSPRVVVLDGATGGFLHTLDTSIATGGTFSINMVGVADDGAVYVANLSTSTATPNLRVYRWADDNEGTFPTVAFEGDPAGLKEDGITSNNPQRWGDSMDVRGSGVGTQLLFGSRNGTVAALLSTVDGENFTSKLITGAHASGSLGVAFGAGNTIWSKLGGQDLRWVAFDPATGAGTLTKTFTGFHSSTAPIGVDAAKGLLGIVQYGGAGATQTVKVYDARDPVGGLILIDEEPFPTTNNNGNGVGAVDISGDLVLALDTNNGLMALKVVPTVVAPNLVREPANTTISQGGYGSLSVEASGTPPLSYQWKFNGENIPTGTGPVLSFTNVGEAQAGTYMVEVRNAAGTTPSREVTLTVAPSVLSDRATPLWSIPGGGREYITTGNTERGVAYNAVNNHVLVVSRTSDVGLHVLDGDSGEKLWQMNLETSIVAGSNPGGFRLNMVGVAEDGVVYAANLDTGGSLYSIYRWENDSAEAFPSIAWTGDPIGGQRVGDTFTVRGSGVNTQILISARNSATVVVFTTFDGFNFVPNAMEIGGAAAGQLGLGVAFGAGNTLWGKVGGQQLIRASFDIGTASATLLNSYESVPLGSGPIAVSTSSNLLAVVTFENPDQVRLFDISDLEAGPVLVDQDFFASDNGNVNGTGSAAFGRDRLYALNTNNGLLALKLGAGSTPPSPATLSGAKVEGGAFKATLSGTANATYSLEKSTDLASWSAVGNVTIPAGGSLEVSDTLSGGAVFYRAVAR